VTESRRLEGAPTPALGEGDWRPGDDRSPNRPWATRGIPALWSTAKCNSSQTKPTSFSSMTQDQNQTDPQDWRSRSLPVRPRVGRRRPKPCKSARKASPCRARRARPTANSAFLKPRRHRAEMQETPLARRYADAAGGQQRRSSRLCTVVGNDPRCGGSRTLLRARLDNRPRMQKKTMGLFSQLDTTTI
jgi:hypothetical protein